MYEPIPNPMVASIKLKLINAAAMNTHENVASTHTTNKVSKNLIIMA